MISKSALSSKFMSSAHSVVRSSGLSPDHIAPPTIAAKRMAAVRFAQAVTKRRFRKAAVVLPYSPLPQKGYVSWLLVRPLGIAFDGAQVSSWWKRRSGNAPQPDVQIARAIMHELGHMFATPGLLSRTRKRIKKNGKFWTPACTPQEEEKAWVWALLAFGIALGHYARDRREHGLIDSSGVTAI